MAIKPIAASAVLALLAGCGPISPAEETARNNQVIAQMHHASAVCAQHKDEPLTRLSCERDLVMQKAIQVKHPDKDLLEEYFTVPFVAVEMATERGVSKEAAIEYMHKEQQRIAQQVANRANARSSERIERQRFGAALALGMQQYGQSQALQNQRPQTNCTSSLTGRFMNTTCY